jgi:bifunctional DNA-binding transcriptional regulator/antitoxin component of YhaV-PrlF toxin-antitoxin module
MTITMTTKNQVTLPKKMTAVLGLKKGTLFDVTLSHGGIQLIPLETRPGNFSKKTYEQLEKISEQEKGMEKPITKRWVSQLKKGMA